MVNLIINGRGIAVPEGSTILEAAEANGISIPHLCFLKDINEIGACRLCSVEVKGVDKLVPSCITKVEEGMEVITNNSHVKEANRTNLAFIMSHHDGRCSQCVRSGNCALQSLCQDYSLDMTGYIEDVPRGKQTEWAEKFPLIRDNTRCIKCMRCIQVCDKVQNMHVWDLVGTGGWTRVGVAGNRRIEDADCTLCGQCIVACPTAALKERDDRKAVRRDINNEDLITVAQIAPAIRTAFGEEFGLDPKVATVNRLAGALRQLGFDYVFDTSYGADLTIMEEGSEFLERKKTGDLDRYPMFTSCCPGWVRFLRFRYPELADQLSTSKSPHTMFGSMVKSFFAREKGIDPAKIRVVSIMPCVAKKEECDLPTERNAEGLKDVDYVLTTREIVRMIKASRIDLASVEESPFDSLMGDYTGAGVIFGVTGGVMEAALRSAAYFATGRNPDIDAFAAFRSSRAAETENEQNHPWREAEYEIGGMKVRAAVTSGLANADAICQAILRGEVHYDFVEVMACPGGCSSGGGQPLHQDDHTLHNLRASRGEVLHRIDEKMKIRYSHENPDIQKLYAEFLGNPLSEKAEELLHVDHRSDEWKDWPFPG